MHIDPSVVLPRAQWLAVTTLGLVASFAAVRALRGLRAGGVLRAGDVLLGLAVAGAARFVAEVVPTFAREAYFVGVDVDWIDAAVRQSLVLADRVVAVREVAALYYLGAGLDPARWAWSVLALHLLNGALLFALARQLSLGARAAAVVAAGFVANPAMVTSLAPSYVCEVRLLTGYLGVCVAYLARARARTPRVAAAWLGVEVCLFFVGCGNKESFLVYPALLVALEGTALRRPLPGAARPWSRLWPHLALCLLGAVALVPFMAREAGYLVGPAFRFTTPVDQLQQIAEASLAPTLFGVARWSGLAALALVVLRAVRARAEPPAVFGLAFFLVAALPMLSFERRLFPGYLYPPWAGLALCLLSVAAGEARTAERALVAVWLASLLVSDPAVRTWPQGEYYPPALAALRALPPDACLAPTPTWSVPPAVLEQFVTGDPRLGGGRPGEPRTEPAAAERQLRVLFRIHCEGREVAVVLPDAAATPP